MSQTVIGDAYSLQNTKLLQKIFGDFLQLLSIYWDEVVDLLLDEIFEQEVKELNLIQYNQRVDQQRKYIKRAVKGGRAHSGNNGSFNNYEKLDLKEVMSVFDEYIQANKRLELCMK